MNFVSYKCRISCDVNLSNYASLVDIVLYVSDEKKFTVSHQTVLVFERIVYWRLYVSFTCSGHLKNAFIFSVPGWKEAGGDWCSTEYHKNLLQGSLRRKMQDQSGGDDRINKVFILKITLESKELLYPENILIRSIEVNSFKVLLSSYQI